MRTSLLSLVLTLGSASFAVAQQAAMTMTQPQTLVETVLQHTTSGTSIEPALTPVPMLMRDRGGWLLMLHGEGFAADIQQSAADDRGGDKLFSTNWVMPMAERRFGRQQITLRGMFSLEPATITGGFYPELFQQGETAAGKAIVDGQHPHDFFMELAAIYDLKIDSRAVLTLYAAPVGDPALGPTAYPHRESASEDAVAALGHHQEDSTHIAFNVVTAGLTYGALRIEGSGFHGAEPTEARWHLQPSPNGTEIDSYATRLTWAPSKELAAQYSIGHLTSPEALELNENQTRQTASVMYTRAIGAHHDTKSMPGMDMATPATGEWASTLVWGRTKSTPGNLVEDSYLLESLLRVKRNSMWTRIESAARTSELLASAPAIESNVGQVWAYSLGYDREVSRGARMRIAPGAQFTVDRTPAALVAAYGRTTFAATIFVRLRIGRGE